MAAVMEEVHLTTIKPKNNVLLLAQEISFAKVLACNDKRLRDRGIRRLKKWLMARSQGSVDFTKDDHLRIWKGLFYCMWMADKPLVQEELAEEICQLIHSFATFKASLLFVETFYASLSIEWFGIDQLRLDKFLMLVRRFVRQSLELVAHVGWPEDKVQLLVDVYLKTLISAPMGLSMHIIEVFCEELAKVGKGELSSKTILQFVKMFACVLAKLNDGRMISQITRCVFLHLIRQTELGIQHHLKFSAWKEFGFPGGDLDAAEMIQEESSDEEENIQGSDDEEEEERKVGVDARAGNVDVLLPPLDFNPKDLLIALTELRNKDETTTKARKTFIQLISKYDNLAAGKYPLGLHKVDLPSKTDKKKEIDEAVKRLWAEEENGTFDETNTSKNKVKNKQFKTNKPLWEVSEAEESVSHSNSVCDDSWEVSDSKNEGSSSSKRRKINENDEFSTGSNFSESIKDKTACLIIDSKEKHVSPVTKKRKMNVENILEEPSKDENTCSKKSQNRIKKKNVGAQKRNPIKNNPSFETEAGDVSTSMTNCNSPTLIKKTTNKQGNSSSKVNKENELQLNVSTAANNNGWGGDWDEPLESGEYEIFIPNKKYVKKRKAMGLSHPVSSIVKGGEENITPKNTKNILKTSTPSSSQKKVEFNLSANCSQEFKEYKRKVKLSKKEVPFDASRKPTQGLLKNSTPSPINPFYKKKLKFLSFPGFP